MNGAVILGAALVLDLILGDPRQIPHPVSAIAHLATLAEAHTRNLLPPLWAGAVTFATTIGGTLGITAALLWSARLLHPLAGDITAVLIIYTGLAARGLCTHGYHVWRALNNNDLPKARRMAGMMVGRDTDQLDENEVVRATLESLGENLVDGVTAPLFFAALGGPLGIVLYKTVNTMDSMFGYRNERYLLFGRIPARADDLLNFLPARLTGLVMPLAAAVCGLSAKGAARILRRDRLAHQSPNAGHGEAAMAGALGVQLGGTSTYQGIASHKPHLGDPGEPLEKRHISRAIRLVIATTLVFILPTGWLITW